MRRVRPLKGDGDEAVEVHGSADRNKLERVLAEAMLDNAIVICG
jgi:hypothetical protein